LDANDSGEQNVDIAALDFLQGAWVQTGRLRKAFLGQIARHPLTANIGTEGLDDLFLRRRFGHASLRRESGRHDHALMGRILLDFGCWSLASFAL